MTDRSSKGWTLGQVETAVRAAWSPETAHAAPEYLARSDHPGRGQCGTTALVVCDLLGGDLLVARLDVPGVPDAVHYWNRLPDGTEIDLTTGQLCHDEVLHEPQVVALPPTGPPSGPGRDAYDTLATRVAHLLSSTEG